MGIFDGHHDRPLSSWKKHPLGDVPEGEDAIPLGQAKITRAGSDVTVLAYGTMVYVAEAAAQESGVDAEVIDLRSLLPLDLDTIVASVAKPGAASSCMRPPEPGWRGADQPGSGELLTTLRRR